MQQQDISSIVIYVVHRVKEILDNSPDRKEFFPFERS